MALELNNIPFAFDALAPHIDLQTMEIHHDRHHAAYTNNLNAAIKGTAIEGKKIEEILADSSSQEVAVRNKEGVFYNHNLFREIMASGGAKHREGDLLKSINPTFGTYKDIKEAFTKAALTGFGSGGAWLVKQGESLVISSSPNQDNPLMDLAEMKGTLLLGVDVWKHTTYLK